MDALWGVGPVTAKKLRARGIEKLVDVRTADPQLLRDAVGSLAEWLEQLARGIDERPVVAEHDPKSSGSESTFAHDLTDIGEIRTEIDSMARDAAAWLERNALYARTVTIKVRYSDFTTDHAQPHRAGHTRGRATSRGAPSRCWTGPRPAASRCGCSASASTTCARRSRPQSLSEARLPFDA